MCACMCMHICECVFVRGEGVGVERGVYVSTVGSFQTFHWKIDKVISSQNLRRIITLSGLYFQKITVQSKCFVNSFPDNLWAPLSLVNLNAKKWEGNNYSAKHLCPKYHKDETWQDKADTLIIVISVISLTNNVGTIPITCLKEYNTVTLTNKGKLLQ